MKSKAAALLLLIALLSAALVGCSRGPATVDYNQLIADAPKYNGQTINLEAFYFGGFEVSALAGSLMPAETAPGRLVPVPPLIWVEGGMPQAVLDSMYTQTVTPSGYAEQFGKVRVTGKFETGGKYGHLDGYQYQVTVTGAELLDWTHPAQ